MLDVVILILWVAAFALASLAAQSWRELAILLAVSALWYLPLKWISLGTEFGAAAVIVKDTPDKWSLSLTPTGALGSAILLGAATMILARHIRLTREERRTNAGPK